MKKIYFLLIALCLFNGVNAQIINIPDPNFKATLLSGQNSFDSNWNPVVIDINSNGEIEVNEALQVNILLLNNSFISSLVGIQYFNNVTELNCAVNLLTSLDVSSLANLQMLDCSDNQLTTMNVSGLTNLVTLACDGNQLTVLDVSGLTNLKELYSSGNNLTSLYLNNLPNLEILNCSENQINALNIGGLIRIKELYCHENQIVSLDAGGLIDLERIWCYDNQLTFLNVSSLPNLDHLACNQNQLSVLNLNGLTNLRLLSCNNNLISSLDLNNLTNLELLECNYNSLTSLDVSRLANLDFLKCTNNQLVTLLIKNGSVETTLEFHNNPTLEYVCADDSQIATVQNVIDFFGYINCHVNTYCSFVPGGVYYVISGDNKYDNDSNGCDASDLGFPNLNFSISDGTNVGSFISNVSGNYSIPVQAGTHTIAPIFENPAYFNISPSNAIVELPTQASPFTQDFCITANGIHPDLEVTLMPVDVARPGFDATYKLVYKNKGNQIQSGTLNLSFDDAILDFVSANPVIANQTTNNLTWDFTNLLPFETREITLTLNLNSPMETPAVNGGDVLNYTTAITSAATDEMPNDNTFTLNHVVVNSFDPNDKTCLEGATIAPSEVGKYVHYMIRFENTGTFPAENIVVKDMIDTAKFDINSLVPIKGSHNFVTRINGNKVEFIFENINLPFDDANNDGYVAFKIKTKPTLVTGNTFSNSASIYFDYNFPIVTNTAVTTIQALSTQDFAFGTYFTVYPNPVNNVLNIETKQTIEVSSVSIYNQLGQLVLVIPNAQNTKSVDVSSLSSGNYFIKINSDKGTSNAKFVKK